MQPLKTRDGVHLFHHDWGSGPPILFLATRGQTADMWGSAMVSLAAQGFRCIAYDRRGHGRSDKPGGGYDYDTLADDLAAVIEGLGLTGLTLVGHSMGGGEVVRYLSRHGPERVLGAALVSAPLPCMMRTFDNPDGVPEADMLAVRAAIAADFPKWCADIADAYFAPDTSAQMKLWSADMALQTSLLAMLALDKAFSEADFRPELAALRTPTLVIHGDQDIFVPLARTAALAPGARLQVYAGAPHGLPLTHTARLVDDLAAFARR